uniref:Uncharacterized protein n=1 Tax=Nymphaea colorata TaxID=210225 RepID=A0A5K1DC36_9MAGN
MVETGVAKDKMATENQCTVLTCLLLSHTFLPTKKLLPHSQTKEEFLPLMEEIEPLVEAAEEEAIVDFELGSKCKSTIKLRSLRRTTPVAFKVQTSWTSSW